MNETGQMCRKILVGTKIYPTWNKLSDFNEMASYTCWGNCITFRLAIVRSCGHTFVLQRVHRVTKGASCCKGCIVLQRVHRVAKGASCCKGCIVLQRVHRVTKGASCCKGCIMLQRVHRVTKGASCYKGCIVLQKQWGKTVQKNYERYKCHLKIGNVGRRYLSLSPLPVQSLTRAPQWPAPPGSMKVGELKW
jgi:hypothetical protein